MNEFASRQRDITPRSRPTNLPPRPGSGPMRRDSNLSDRGDGDRARDRDRDRDKERGKDTRPSMHRQTSGISPVKSGLGYPSSPKLSDGPTENGETASASKRSRRKRNSRRGKSYQSFFGYGSSCSYPLESILTTSSPLGKASAAKTQGTRASPPPTPTFSHHPDLKPILDSLSLRSSHFNELHEALETQKKAQNGLNKSLSPDCYSEKTIFRLRLEQAKDRSAKTTKKLEDTDKKLMAMITSFLEKQAKSTQTTEASKAQISSLHKATEASMNEKIEKKFGDLEASMTGRLEEKMKEAEASVSVRLEAKASASDTAIAMKHTELLKEQEEDLTKRLSKKVEDQETIFMERLNKKIREQETLLLERIQVKMAEQNAAVEKAVSQRLEAMEASMATQQQERLSEQRAAIARDAEEEAGRRYQNMATVVQQKISALDASLITPRIQEKLKEYEEYLKPQQQAEKLELLQRLDEQNAKSNTLSQSLEGLRDRMDKTSDAASDIKKQLCQLKTSLDSTNQRKLQEQTAVQHKLIEDLQNHKSHVEAQMREIIDVRPRLVESPPVGSSLSAEQLETRLLVQYKDLNRDIQKLEIRVDKLEQTPASASSFSSPDHKRDGPRSMTDAQIISLINGEATSVIEAFKVKFEKATKYLESFLNTEIDARDDVIKPKLEQLLDDFIVVQEKLSHLEINSTEAGEVSRKVKAEVEALQGQLDKLGNADEEVVRLKSESEDIANRIAHITEWQNNFNSTSMVKDMTNIIQNMTPQSTQSQVSDLAGRVTNLEQYMRHIADPDSHKRRKVAANGNALILHSG